MVGHRSRSFINKEGDAIRKDVEETGKPQQDKKYRFRDNGVLEPDDQRRVEFKTKLLDSVDSADSKLERFRKSDDEVIISPQFQNYSKMY